MLATYVNCNGTTRKMLSENAQNAPVAKPPKKSICCQIFLCLIQWHQMDQKIQVSLQQNFYLSQHPTMNWNFHVGRKHQLRDYQLLGSLVAAHRGNSRWWAAVRGHSLPEASSNPLWELTDVVCHHCEVYSPRPVCQSCTASGPFDSLPLMYCTASDPFDPLLRPQPTCEWSVRYTASSGCLWRLSATSGRGPEWSSRSSGYSLQVKWVTCAGYLLQ